MNPEDKNRSEFDELNEVERAPSAPERSPESDVVPERAPVDQVNDKMAGLQPMTLDEEIDRNLGDRGMSSAQGIRHALDDMNKRDQRR